MDANEMTSYGTIYLRKFHEYWYSHSEILRFYLGNFRGSVFGILVGRDEVHS
jgi:hypothetical protein